MNSSLSNTRGNSRLLQSTACRRHKQVLYMSVETIPKRYLTEEQINEKCEQLHKEGLKFRAKREQANKKLQEKREIEEMKECTFKPVLIESEQYFVPATPFLQRQTTWDKTRIERISRKQEDKKKVELQSCSFKPSLISSTQQLNTSAQTANPHKPCKQNSYLQIYKSRKEPTKTNYKTTKKIPSKPIKIDKRLQESSDMKDEQEHLEANPEKQEEPQPVYVEEDNQEII